MSLVCPIGPEQNLLDASAQHAARLFLPHPVLTPAEMAALKEHAHRGWSATTLDASFAKDEALASPYAREAGLCAEQLALAALEPICGRPATCE